MIHRQALADDLNQLMIEERHSLMRHLAKATPYLDSRTYPIWQKLKAQSQLTADHVHRLADLLDRWELPERAGSFDPKVANYHFADLGFLLPLLIDELKQRVAAYQRAMDHAKDERALRGELAVMFEENRQILNELEQARQMLEN